MSDCTWSTPCGRLLSSPPPLCLAGLQVHVRLYVEYPLRPPLLLVKGLKDVPRDRKTAPRTLGSATVNQLAWLEHEVWGGGGL